jgi:hypothetical protein
LCRADRPHHPLAGYGYCPSHSRWYWGSKLLLLVTCDGTVTGFSLANPKLAGEREHARTMLERQPASRPAPGTAIVTDKGLSGQDTEAFFARPDLALTLIRPGRKDDKQPRPCPNWLRQRAEAIIRTRLPAPDSPAGSAARSMVSLLSGCAGSRSRESRACPRTSWGRS